MEEQELRERILDILEGWYYDDLISQHEVDSLSRNIRPIINIIRIAGEDNIDAILLNAIEIIK